jgi:hypothetical protein
MTTDIRLSRVFTRDAAASKPDNKNRQSRPVSNFGLATLLLSISFLTIPGFASGPYSQRSPSAYHPWNDLAAKAYSHNGLPCSTAPVSGTLVSKASHSLRELDQIERASVTTLRNVPRQTAPTYRALESRSSGKPAFNFTYHASPFHAGRSSAKGR